MKLKYTFYSLLFTFFANTIVAETSEQYVDRSEFMFCKLNDGKSYQDVVAEQLPYEKFLRERGLKYNRLNLLPIWDNNAEYDYVMWGNWPDGMEQYKEWGAYMNDYPQWASDNGIPAQTAGKCENIISMMNHGVFHIRTPQEDRDERAFSDWRQCKLKPNADMVKLKSIFAKMEQAARDFGAEGYGIHFFTPYRGFQEKPPFDFLMMHHWYSAEDRAKGVEQWPEWRDYLEATGLPRQRDMHIESCSGADTYQIDWVYSSIN